MDLAVLDQMDVDLIAKFCELWIKGFVPNQSIRADYALRCEIGSQTYKQAKAAFFKWRLHIP